MDLEPILRILGSRVITKDALLELISDDDYLRPRFGSMLELESFLERHSQYFMVENGLVCTNSMQLLRGRETAVEYYSGKLDTYVEPLYYMNLRGHIGQADKDIWAFIETFYHEEDFIDFLLAHPDDFVVFDDDTVHLVDEMEKKSVEFYKRCIQKYGGGKYFTNFRGHYANNKYVREYIQQYYPEEEFWDFLQNNDDVFDSDDGHVYLR